MRDDLCLMPSAPLLPTAEDRRLARMTKICLALPRGHAKRYRPAWFLRGAEETVRVLPRRSPRRPIVAACFKVAPGENVDLAGSDPGRYYPPAYIGARG